VRRTEKIRPLHVSDPLAARSPSLVRFFGGVMARAMAASFHKVRIAEPGVPRLPAGRSVIVYANHPSWWDPAFFIVLATKLFSQRQGFGPIDIDALARYRFMSRIGLFGIEPSSRRGAARFLKTGLRILDNPQAMLWITPEGRFTDVRARPVRLRPGLAHLARRAPRVLLVPLALEYVFWEERTPEALCRFGHPIDAGSDLGHSIDTGSALLQHRLEETMEALALAAIARDPDRFSVLLRGRAGVGGVYDRWRWLRARLRNEEFRSEHGRL
jgi:1-acyl-sn-glycerol-3-phosphate acyltransferase